MADDDLELGASEEAVETPETTEPTEPDQPEAAEDAEVEDDEGGEGEEGDGDEVEEVEFDFGGEKLTLPKDAVPEELAERISNFTKGTWADYTRRSQELAERSKTVEAQEGAIGKLAGLQGETLQLYSQGLALRSEIEQLQASDLNRLWQSHPDQARRISDQISQKSAQFSSIVQQVAQQEAALSDAQTQERQRRAEEGKAQMERRIKGFSQKADEVVDYVVKTYGFTAEEAQSWPLNPRTAEMAYKAMLWDRAQTQARSKGRVVEPAPKAPVRPIKGKGGQTARLDLVADADKMSADDWMKRRNAQLAKQAQN